MEHLFCSNSLLLAATFAFLGAGHVDCKDKTEPEYQALLCIPPLLEWRVSGTASLPPLLEF